MPDQNVPGQGNPLPDVNEIMARTIGQLRRHFEPFAIDSATEDKMEITSIAISLKRIADSVGTMCVSMANSSNAALSVASQLSNAGNYISVGNAVLAQIRDSLHQLDSTTRSNEGRELRITIAKE